MAARVRVFTSFQYEDVHYARLMEAWAANENQDFALYSERLRVAINSERGAYIRSLLAVRIGRASVFVCLIGTGTARSSWVKWEIREARRQGKGMVAVMLKRSNAVPVPIRNAGALFVSFRQAEISKAIAYRTAVRPSTEDWHY